MTVFKSLLSRKLDLLELIFGTPDLVFFFLLSGEEEAAAGWEVPGLEEKRQSGEVPQQEEEEECSERPQEAAGATPEPETFIVRAVQELPLQRLISASWWRR